MKSDIEMLRSTTYIKIKTDSLIGSSSENDYTFQNKNVSQVKQPSSTYFGKPMVIYTWVFSVYSDFY